MRGGGVKRKLKLPVLPAQVGLRIGQQDWGGCRQWWWADEGVSGRWREKERTKVRAKCKLKLPMLPASCSGVLGDTLTKHVLLQLMLIKSMFIKSMLSLTALHRSRTAWRPSPAA